MRMRTRRAAPIPDQAAAIAATSRETASDHRQALRATATGLGLAGAGIRLGGPCLLGLGALALLVRDPLLRLGKPGRGLLGLFGPSGALLGLPPSGLLELLPAARLRVARLAAGVDQPWTSAQPPS